MFEKRMDEQPVDGGSPNSVEDDVKVSKNTPERSVFLKSVPSK